MKNPDIQLPEGEIGFIALHIHSAMTNRPLSEVNQHSQLISRLVQVIEDSFQMQVRQGKRELFAADQALALYD